MQINNHVHCSTVYIILFSDLKLFVNSCNAITVDTRALENLQHCFETISEVDEAIINEFMTKGAAMFQLEINIKAAKACLLNFKDVVENIMKDEPSTTQQCFCQTPTNQNFMRWAKALTLTAKKNIKSSPAIPDSSKHARNRNSYAINTTTHKFIFFQAVR